MITELRKSISSILYERSTSPLYGSFIISWIIWNWKIPYISLFVSTEKINNNKLDWIVENASSLHNLITYPLISTIVLITIFPFLSNGAFWLSLKFNKWRIDQKHSIEKKSLLTVEQSISIREELLASEERIEKLLENKNNEIKQLSTQIEHLESQLKESATSDKAPDDPDTTLDKKEATRAADTSSIYEVETLVDKILSNPALNQTFNTAIEYIQGGYNGLVEQTDSGALAFLEAW